MGRPCTTIWRSSSPILVARSAVTAVATKHLSTSLLNHLLPQLCRSHARTANIRLPASTQAGAPFAAILCGLAPLPPLQGTFAGGTPLEPSSSRISALGILPEKHLISQALDCMSFRGMSGCWKGGGGVIGARVVAGAQVRHHRGEVDGVLQALPNALLQHPQWDALRRTPPSVLCCAPSSGPSRGPVVTGSACHRCGASAVTPSLSSVIHGTLSALRLTSRCRVHAVCMTGGMGGGGWCGLPA